MKNSLDRYLNQIQGHESVFPIDSVHKVRKPLDVKNPRHDWEDETEEKEENVT